MAKYEMKLINSKSGYGWYCRFNRLEPEPKGINEGTGELFHRVKNLDDAIKSFKNTIISFGGNKSDFENIEKSGEDYQVEFKSEIIVV